MNLNEKFLSLIFKIGVEKVLLYIGLEDCTCKVASKSFEPYFEI